MQSQPKDIVFRDGRGEIIEDGPDVTGVDYGVLEQGSDPTEPPTFIPPGQNKPTNVIPLQNDGASYNEIESINDVIDLTGMEAYVVHQFPNAHPPQPQPMHRLQQPRSDSSSSESGSSDDGYRSGGQDSGDKSDPSDHQNSNETSIDLTHQIARSAVERIHSMWKVQQKMSMTQMSPKMRGTPLTTLMTKLVTLPCRGMVTV